MLSVNYQYLKFSRVLDLNDFYKSKLPEIIKIRSVIDNIKLLLAVSNNRLILEVAEGERIYKITVLTPDVKKIPYAYFAYIPKDNRFDVFNADSNIPVIQWKNKKPVFKNYSMLLDKMGLDKLFTKIVNPL